MTESFQNGLPNSRVNIRFYFSTCRTIKKIELPLRLMVAADLSNGLLTAALSVYEKGNVNNNNFNAILSEYSQKGNLTVKNSLADDGSENNIGLTFCTSRWKAWASTHYRVDGCRNPGHKARGN
ncbi:type VI secretion system contractile sheath small subunit [Raoultella terrigena]|uniref:type VI secretion system contractile sheath small subunit n=1 Tax=Raoultella terrigena TaxID=577 RepID=UPI00142F4477|nr:type VI secretion system contractile sheath small subunit [Raoultella terrigena]QIT27718.1 hypothetical protein HCK03_07045 [Raoultella terrigena]